MNIEIRVANGNDERWKWKTVKDKSDRKDAMKLAQLSEMENLPTVHLPRPEVRQWRSLIEYRHSLVARRTAIKNSIRSIYERQGLDLPSRTCAWTQQALAELGKEVAAAASEQVWLLQVGCELEQLRQVQKQIGQVEAKLKQIADGNEAVKRLRKSAGRQRGGEGDSEKSRFPRGRSEVTSSPHHCSIKYRNAGL